MYKATQSVTTPTTALTQLISKVRISVQVLFKYAKCSETKEANHGDAFQITFQKKICQYITGFTNWKLFFIWPNA